MKLISKNLIFSRPVVGIGFGSAGFASGGKSLKNSQRSVSWAKATQQLEKQPVRSLTKPVMGTQQATGESDLSPLVGAKRGILFAVFLLLVFRFRLCQLDHPRSSSSGLVVSSWALFGVDLGHFGAWRSPCRCRIRPRRPILTLLLGLGPFLTLSEY